MSDNPLVSVVIPCYNHSVFLKDAVQSIIDQTYNNWECLIIDDGSTDSTSEVTTKLMQLDSRIKYIHQDNKGLAAARNTGLSNAKGLYLQFLDADDLIHCHKLSEQILLMNDNVNIDVSYTNYQLFTGEISETIEKQTSVCLGSNPLEDFMFRWEQDLSIPIHAAVFRKRSLGVVDNLFNEDLKAKEDWVMWVKLALKGARFEFIDKEYCFYRQHELSLTADLINMHRSYTKAVCVIHDLIPAKYKNHFLDRSFSHIEAYYLNTVNSATLYFDLGKGFNDNDCLKNEITIKRSFNIKEKYSLPLLASVTQLRFDPIEGFFCQAKVERVKYSERNGNIKCLDLCEVRSNGTLNDTGSTIFETVDPMFIIPISGDIEYVEIDCAVEVYTFKKIEHLLREDANRLEYLTQKNIELKLLVQDMEVIIDSYNSPKKLIKELCKKTINRVIALISQLIRLAVSSKEIKK
jgi:glycosyltransferase involved in cell wall biosynthesis